MTTLVASSREVALARVLADARRRLRELASLTEDRETRRELLELADELEGAGMPRRRPLEAAVPRSRLEVQT